MFLFVFQGVALQEDTWLESPFFLSAMVFILACSTVFLAGTCVVLAEKRQELSRDRRRTLVRYVYLDSNGREVNDRTALLGAPSLSTSL